MAATHMTQAPVVASPSYPWRRGPDYLQSKTLSVEAPVFVPSWEEPKEAAAPPTSGNCCLISLGAYSDDSDEEEARPQPVATPKTAEAPAAADAPTMCLRSRRPWRVSAPEFVPGGLSLEPAAVADDASGAPEALSKGGEGGRSKPAPPWRRASSDSPQAAVSSPTLSTSEGSPSASGGSLDGGSSASSASCASRSRSPTPPPVPEEESPMNISSLLRWRPSACERPVERLPFSAEPEPGTPAAAAAEAAAAAAAAPPTPAVSSPVGGGSPGSWRRSEEPSANAGDSWRDVKPVEKLEVSQDSFAARQRARRGQRGGDTDTMSDEEVVRALRSILNKLTLEKFDALSVQLTQCGIRSTLHLQLLIQEVFEKATTQHHFIDMYADLCTLLDGHFTAHPIISDPKMNFKKILLNCCQASFERHLTPPPGIAALNGEERTAAERKYKMCMLGNIKFVGALLVRKMLASKVMLAIMEELLQDPTPEALESLAALLVVVGPTFDTPDWAYRATLNAVFAQVEKISKKATIHSRPRYLLKDVLDLRNSGWEDRRPKKIEGPLKLEQVAAKAAMENGSGWVSQKAPSSGNDWESVGGARLGKISSVIGAKHPTSPCSPTSGVKASALSPLKEKAAAGTAEKTTRGGTAGAAMLEFLKNREQPKEPSAQPPKEAAQFDRAACTSEVAATLRELRVSHDVPEAAARIASIAVPVKEQPQQLDELLASVCSEGAQAARKVGFELATLLFLDGHWLPASAVKGVRSFLEDTCPDLKFDVPTLPRIVREELQPALAPLVNAGVMKADQHSAVVVA